MGGRDARQAQSQLFKESFNHPLSMTARPQLLTAAFDFAIGMCESGHVDDQTARLASGRQAERGEDVQETVEGGMRRDRDRDRDRDRLCGP
jgi:hypothetical protein